MKAPRVSAGSTRFRQSPRPEVGKRSSQSEQQDEQDADEERRRRLPDQGHAHRRVVEERVRASSRRGARSGSRPRWRTGRGEGPARAWRAPVPRPPSWPSSGSGSSGRSRPATASLRKTPYWTEIGRSRPSSRRTRSISAMGASGGSRSGTGSPDRRMTTKTTVDHAPQRDQRPEEPVGEESAEAAHRDLAAIHRPRTRLPRPTLSRDGAR